MQHEPKFRAGVRRAVEILGSQRALDDVAGKRGATWTALNTRRSMPVWLAVRIVDATGGQVSIKDLLPDVYQRVEAELGERVALP